MLSVPVVASSLIQASQVAAFRLHRQHLLRRSRADLATVCTDVCGIQAQVMSAAHMALCARMHRLQRTAIDSALWERRTLVKTSCMRQTLHLLAAPDYLVYITALRKSRMQALHRVMSRFSILPRELDVLHQAVEDALRDGPLTNGELGERVASKASKGLLAWMELSWSVFRPAVVEGLICYGPERGTQVTFVRVDQWLPKQKPISEGKAQQLLLRCYLAAYGPATLQDFSKWSGIPMKDARALWDSLKDDLTEVRVDEKKTWILREDLKQLSTSSLDTETVRLLPSFDPYMLAHSDKTQFLDPRHYKRVYRNAGWLSPVILVNGQVTGIWSTQRGGGRLSLEVEPFEKLSKLSKNVRAKIEEEAAILGAFYGTACDVHFLTA